MKNTAHAQVWMNGLYIFQVFTEYYLIYTCTLNLEKISLTIPTYTSFLLSFWKRSSQEKSMWFWLVNQVGTQPRLPWTPSLLHSSSDIRWVWGTCLETSLGNVTSRYEGSSKFLSEQESACGPSRQQVGSADPERRGRKSRRSAGKAASGQGHLFLMYFIFRIVSCLFSLLFPVSPTVAKKYSSFSSWTHTVFSRV